jgi:hypothetical protein
VTPDPVAPEADASAATMPDPRLVLTVHDGRIVHEAAS